MYWVRSSEFFAAAYGISVKGNWEGKTVLQRALDDASLAARFSLPQSRSRLDWLPAIASCWMPRGAASAPAQMTRC